METQKNTSSLKAIVVVLALLLAGSLAYIFKMTSDATALNNELTIEKDEKQKILEELENLKITYEKAIEDNTALSDDLIAEREKVINLIADLKKSKADAASMVKYKEEYFRLQSQMKILVAENNELKKKNEILTFERDSTANQLGNQKQYNEDLILQNEDLAKKVAIASKLNVTNLKVQAVKVKSSGKKIDTERASRADELEVCFSVSANAVAKSGEKKYYVQIIDVKGNVIGDKKTERFNNEDLIYSFETNIAYDGTAMNVCEYLDSYGKSFEKGTYFVNIFDRSELVSATSFNLK